MSLSPDSLQAITKEADEKYPFRWEGIPGYNETQRTKREIYIEAASLYCERLEKAESRINELTREIADINIGVARHEHVNQMLSDANKKAEGEIKELKEKLAAVDTAVMSQIHRLIKL